MTKRKIKSISSIITNSSSDCIILDCFAIGGIKELLRFIKDTHESFQDDRDKERYSGMGGEVKISRTWKDLFEFYKNIYVPENKQKDFSEEDFLKYWEGIETIQDASDRIVELSIDSGMRGTINILKDILEVDRVKNTIIFQLFSDYDLETNNKNEAKNNIKVIEKIDSEWDRINQILEEESSRYLD